MSFILGLFGAISSIATIIKAITAIKDAIGEAAFNRWISSLESNTVEWKKAKTAEEKSAAAKKMVELIGGIPS